MKKAEKFVAECGGHISSHDWRMHHPKVGKPYSNSECVISDKELSEIKEIRDVLEITDNTAENALNLIKIAQNAMHQVLACATSGRSRRTRKYKNLKALSDMFDEFHNALDNMSKAKTESVHMKKAQKFIAECGGMAYSRPKKQMSCGGSNDWSWIKSLDPKTQKQLSDTFKKVAITMQNNDKKYKTLIVLLNVAILSITKAAKIAIRNKLSACMPIARKIKTELNADNLEYYFGYDIVDDIY